MEKKRLAALMLKFAESYPPGIRPTPEDLAAMASHLVDLEEDPLTRALADLVKTSQWFPSVAEIRRRAMEVATGLPSPEEAWRLVRRHIEDHPFLPRPIIP